MRRRATAASIALLAGALATSAAAQPGRAPAADPGPERPDLWRRITDPHGDEVRALVEKARLSMTRADDARAGDQDWAVDQRARFYRDAYNLAAHARTLAPENLDALDAFSRAADELGETAEAVGALELSARLTGPARADVAVVGRLGALYLRAGDVDRAIRWLRLAQGPARGEGLAQTYAIVHLATALAARGEVTAGLHVIGEALPPPALGQSGPDVQVLELALAVLYDRDEERGAAFEVLDHLQSTLGGRYQALLQIEIARLPFQPPEDLFYYRALLYESLDRYVEARAEWALYAAAGAPPFRARALDHIAAIDAQRRAESFAKPAPPGAPSRAIPRRLPAP